MSCLASCTPQPAVPLGGIMCLGLCCLCCSLLGYSWSVAAVAAALIVLTNVTQALNVSVQIFSLRAAVLFFGLD